MRQKGQKFPSAPTHLTGIAREWWMTTIREWDLDANGMRLLQLAADALQRGEEARQVIAKQGATYVDRFGAPRRHPATVIERDAAATFARLVRQLGLKDAPAPGHPRNQWRRPPEGL